MELSELVNGISDTFGIKPTYKRNEVEDEDEFNCCSVNRRNEQKKRKNGIDYKGDTMVLKGKKK